MLRSLFIVAVAGLFFATSTMCAKSPYTMPDGSWITLKGTVTSTGNDQFMLDYGEGIVKVEMDDWDRYDEASIIFDSDEVTVTGKVDDDLFEITKIEASSVWVKDLNTYIYASAADEESTPMVVTTYYDADLWLSGKVTGTSGRKFTLDTGKREITVDTWGMPYNLMDDLGFQQIDKGDWVTVTGDIHKNLFDKRELDAESIVTVVNGKK